MAVQIGSPFKAAFPYNGDTGYVAEAAEIRDMEWNGTSGAGAKQSQINQEFKSELESVQLTSDELDAIVNEVDMDGIRIIATAQAGQSGDDFVIYRFDDGDVERSESKNDICFSKPDGTKYYLYVEYSKKDFDDDPDLWNALIGEVLYGEVEGKSDSHYQVKKVENVPSNS